MDRKSEELKRLAAMRDEDIDFSDIPERLDWSGAVRGKFYRPVKQQEHAAREKLVKGSKRSR